MYRELYKQNMDKNERQELRRQKLLQEQKIKRLEQQDEQRELIKISKVFHKTKYKQHTFHELYGDDMSLQLSEWLREKPDDLEEWVLVPCPKGQRCLVVSGRGKTKMFNKMGRFRMSFKSLLPGGGAAEGGKGGGSGFTILDCIYNAENDKFYVLDVLWYGKQCFLDCETQFRFFWLKSKFEEFEEDDHHLQNMDNFKEFRLLKSYDISNEEMTARALQTYPLWAENQPELDGFLFYHKESSYTCGPTPLVCWLFPFMVEELLHMVTNSQYEKPPGYSTPFLYMEEFDKDLARKRQKRQRKQMDYTNDTDSFDSSVSFSQSNKEMEGIDGDIEESEKENETDFLKHVMKAERLLELEGAVQ